MNARICLIIIIMIVLGGCGERTTYKDNAIDIISINPHEAEEYVNLSELADSIICIKLQPAPSDVMGRVVQIIVRKKYIYALDVSQWMIFIFDKTGKFVSKLNKQGAGPDEYLQLGHLFIDDNEEYIELIDIIKRAKLKYTNISFELVEILPLPDISHNACRR
ncbi:MAG: 6-bladed beta-propeller, partial [Holosporales bacterium]|nr:6-bladed beta-propeller [Holosporales bacterium]